MTGGDSLKEEQLSQDPSLKKELAFELIAEQILALAETFKSSILPVTCLHFAKAIAENKFYETENPKASQDNLRELSTVSQQIYEEDKGTILDVEDYITKTYEDIPQLYKHKYQSF